MLDRLRSLVPTGRRETARRLDLSSSEILLINEDFFRGITRTAIQFISSDGFALPADSSDFYGVVTEGGGNSFSSTFHRVKGYLWLDHLHVSMLNEDHEDPAKGFHHYTVEVKYHRRRGTAELKAMAQDDFFGERRDMSEEEKHRFLELFANSHVDKEATARLLKGNQDSRINRSTR